MDPVVQRLDSFIWLLNNWGLVRLVIKGGVSFFFFFLSGLFEQVKRDDLDLTVIMEGVITSVEEGGRMYLKLFVITLSIHFAGN